MLAASALPRLLPATTHPSTPPTGQKSRTFSRGTLAAGVVARLAAGRLRGARERIKVYDRENGSRRNEGTEGMEKRKGAARRAARDTRRIWKRNTRGMIREEIKLSVRNPFWIAGTTLRPRTQTIAITLSCFPPSCFRKNRGGV